VARINTATKGRIERRAVRAEFEIAAPPRTDRPKRGIRLLVIGCGERIVIGGEVFEVTRLLGGGRMLIRPLPRDRKEAESRTTPAKEINASAPVVQS